MIVAFEFTIVVYINKHKILVEIVHSSYFTRDVHL
jgi:hypothetical protein